MLILAPLYPPDRAVAQGTKAAPAGAPKLDAGSWALIDADSGLYLAGKDPDKRVPIASTTKIMVALVALEEGANLNEQVTVSEDAASYAGSVYSNVGLYPYDIVSLGDLLTATLVPSGTDAVYALAEHLGDGSVDEFVGKMNDKAKELGLKNTRFENPAGIDARGNYSSAADLAKITRAAMKYPEFREIVAMPEATISTQDRQIQISSTPTCSSSPTRATTTGRRPASRRAPPSRPGPAWWPRPRAATSPTSPWCSTPPGTCSASTQL